MNLNQIQQRLGQGPSIIKLSFNSTGESSGGSSKKDAFRNKIMEKTIPEIEQILETGGLTTANERLVNAILDGKKSIKMVSEAPKADFSNAKAFTARLLEDPQGLEKKLKALNGDKAGLSKSLISNLNIAVRADWIGASHHSEATNEKVLEIARTYPEIAKLAIKAGLIDADEAPKDTKEEAIAAEGIESSETLAAEEATESTETLAAEEKTKPEIVIKSHEKKTEAKEAAKAPEIKEAAATKSKKSVLEDLVSDTLGELEEELRGPTSTEQINDGLAKIKDLIKKESEES